MAFISEDDVEHVAIDQFQSMGYAYLPPIEADPDGDNPERRSNGDTILLSRLRQAVYRLNPRVAPDICDVALAQITSRESQNLIEENRRVHRLMTDGIPFDYRTDTGLLRHDYLRVIDFEDPDNNDWLVLNQFTIIEVEHERRPDIVVFINGLPLAVLELKAPAAERASIIEAFDQLQTYKAEIPSLFRSNLLLVTSDGVHARYGSLSADLDRFMRWRTADGVATAGEDELEQNVLIQGLFDRHTLLQMLQKFVVFGNPGKGLIKIIAGYHQFYAVRKAVLRTVEATADTGDRKVGVIWHTTGSGKSYLMAFYAGQLVGHPALENPTILVVTDRVDLDDQLYGTFALCEDLLRQTPVQARSREHLQELLSRRAGGVILANIQKFSVEGGDGGLFPLLSERRNILVIADEAHRSQYGFKARHRKDGALAYGFAAHMRNALPHASFIGFTGTPIEKGDKNTPAVFGDYIDTYDLSAAVADEATVPIYYESRLARIDLPDEAKPEIDAQIDALFEDEEDGATARVEALVGAKTRLNLVAADLVEHFEERRKTLLGKAMVVAMSRRICVDLYDEIITLRPDWHDQDVNAGRIKIVMSGSASDPLEFQPHIGNPTRTRTIAKRAADPDDSLLMVIVCDMWLTGFDAPPMHTMYIDKPLRGHTLMQAIARVNRVFRDKPSGLVVDYIGIAQSLKLALADYTDRDQDKTGIDHEQAVSILAEKLDIVRSIFHGFDYQEAVMGDARVRLETLPPAMNWILEYQQKLVVAATSPADKKSAEQAYDDAVLKLSRAYSAAATSDLARSVREEVGFFQTVKQALAKARDVRRPSRSANEMALQQIVDQAIASTEIVEILKVAGLETPNISILSDEFLAEVKAIKQKNLAVEAVRKLLNDEIRSRRRVNVVEAKRFSEQLSDAIAHYHNNAISTVEMLQELIDLAKEVADAKKRGDNQGMSEAELAFYDALATNQSAVDIMGDEALLTIASRLLSALRGNISVDWARRESARALMRRDIKRILNEFGYPPDLAPEAVQIVMKQVEALSDELASELRKE